MKNKTRARRKPQGEWEKLKPIICELYAKKTLEEVREILANDHDIQATKRQLVYRLEKWELKKYYTGEPESPREEVESPEGSASNLRLFEPGDTKVELPAFSALENSAQEPISLGSVNDTDNLEVFNKTNSLSNDNRRDPGADYPQLTRLMIQYMKEAMASGEVFMDSADHVGNGWRLFSWAHEATEAIEATRTSTIPDITATPAWKYLSDDVSLEGIIVDEHPFILGTIFAIWKNATLVDDGDETSRMFLCAVLRNCERLLAPRHLITGIFKCLANGRFDPDYCIDRLGVLPSEIFSRGTRTLDPSFEVDETSDYQTIASLPIRQYQPGFSAKGPLRLKRNLSHDGTSGFFYRSESTSRDTAPKSDVPLDLFHGTRSDNRADGSNRQSANGNASLPDTPTPGGKPMETEVDRGSGSDAEYSSAESTSVSSLGRPQTLDERRKEIVDDVMREFILNLDKYLQGAYGTHEAPDTIDNDGTRTSRSQPKGKAVARPSNTTKRARREANGNPGRDAQDRGLLGNDSDSDSGGDDGHSKKRQRPSQSGIGLVLFACPYFKWNPRKYYREKTCMGPGWDTVRRVKEHLLRCHEKPLYRCRRCHRDLKEDAALDAHMIAEPLCQVVPVRETCDKFNHETASILKKLSKGRKSEVEFWTEIYKHLFDVRNEELPTPYYDIDTSLLLQAESWSEHIRREVRPRLRELLETEAALALDNIVPDLLGRLHGFLRHLEPRLHLTYQQSQDQSDEQHVATPQAASHGLTSVDVDVGVSVPEANNPDLGVTEGNYANDASFNIEAPSWNISQMQVPGLPGFLAQDNYFSQQDNGQTDLVEWDLMEGTPLLDDTNIDWSQWPSGVGESHGTYPGGDGPSGGT